jgi:hypothetical protein
MKIPEMRKNSKIWLFLLVLTGCTMLLTGCTVLNYSQTFIPNYKAKSIAVFPVESGVHVDSAAVMDKFVSDALIDKGWFSKVATASELK